LNFDSSIKLSVAELKSIILLLLFSTSLSLSN